MDLEEYRRIYMQAEGIENTPANTIRRISRLFSNITSIPGAYRQNRADRQERRAARTEAIEDIRKNGVSIEKAADYLGNRPKLHGKLNKAIEKTADSAISTAMSANELGQTAASMVGTRRTNLYDGQDLENGIRFSIKASRALEKGLKLPTHMFHTAENLVGAGAIAGMMVLTPFREIKPERENTVHSKTKEFGKNLPDISDQER